MEQDVGERNYAKSSTYTRVIFEQPLHCRKKGLREPPIDSFKKFQQIYFLGAFQNGKSALKIPEIPFRAGQIAMQDRSQEDIFFSSRQQKLNSQANYTNFFAYVFKRKPAPRIFTKLLISPIVLLGLVNIRIIIYLDDMSLLGRIFQEFLMSRDTLISLVHYLGFVINLKKSVLHPVKQIEFLGLIIDTEKITLALLEKILKHCLNDIRRFSRSQKLQSKISQS